MIRLIYESLDETNDVPSFVPFQRRENDNHAHSCKSESSLVNPFVIGISAFCGVLLVALVVVWVFIQTKLTTRTTGCPSELARCQLSKRTGNGRMNITLCCLISRIKPGPNGDASRRKFSTTCGDLRSIWAQVDAGFSRFGHPTQVNAICFVYF